MVGQTLAAQGVARRDRAAVLLGEGSGVPVHQVPGRRHHPRARDEVHRRSDGRGRDVRRGVREEPARRGRASCPQSGKAFHQVRERRQAARRSRSRGCWPSWASSSSPRAAPRRRSRRPGFRSQPVNKVAEGRPHIVDMLKNGEIALIVNTVEEKRARDPGLATRSAAPRCQTRSPTTRRIAGARAACVGMRATATELTRLRPSRRCTNGSTDASRHMSKDPHDRRRRASAARPSCSG